MEPWSFQLTGSKAEILASLAEIKAPDFVKQALTLLMKPLADLPGFTHEDPVDIWEREVPHTSLETPPMKRLAERIKTHWTVDCGGHPDAYGVTVIRIDPVYEAK